MGGCLAVYLHGGVSELLPRGLVCPEFPGISSCWTVTLDASVQLWGPCHFKTFKKHLLFFVPEAPAGGLTHRSYCPVSLVSSTPRMHCVCAPLRMAGAGCSAVLGSLSLPAPTPLLLPGAGVRGLGYCRAAACILPLSPGTRFSQVWM